ncbi:MAG: hypothetical protein ACYCZU_01950 [Devosia sp.]
MTEFTTTVTAFAIATLIATVATFTIMTMATPAMAETKPVEVVVGACDAMADKDPKSCGYNVDEGGLTGCFSGGPCFYCPVDGSRKCTMIRTGNIRPGLGGLGGRLELAPPQSLSEGAPAPVRPAAPPPGPGSIL